MELLGHVQSVPKRQQDHTFWENTWNTSILQVCQRHTNVLNVIRHLLKTFISPCISDCRLEKSHTSVKSANMNFDSQCHETINLDNAWMSKTKHWKSTAYCKTLPVHLPEADCSIFTLSVVVGRRRLSSSRFVTINSTSIKPSSKVRNLTYYIFGESLWCWQPLGTC